MKNRIKKYLVGLLAVYQVPISLLKLPPMVQYLAMQVSLKPTVVW